MSDTVLVAIIGTVGVVAAAAITAYFNYRASSQKETADSNPITLALLSPKNGEQLPVLSGEKRPILRPISGKVNGFSADEIVTLGLVVQIWVYNGKWHEQGTAVVREDGRWALENGRFDGTHHRIRATLHDKDNIAYVSTDIHVTVMPTRNA